APGDPDTRDRVDAAGRSARARVHDPTGEQDLAGGGVPDKVDERPIHRHGDLALGTAAGRVATDRRRRCGLGPSLVDVDVRLVDHEADVEARIGDSGEVGILRVEHVADAEGDEHAVEVGAG